jgi:hypothetical protein
MKNLFLYILSKLGHEVKRQEKHIAGQRIPSEDERAFFASAMTLNKWADVEYYGPGAEEAEKRRRRTLGLEPEEEVSAGTIGYDVRPD